MRIHINDSWDSKTGSMYWQRTDIARLIFYLTFAPSTGYMAWADVMLLHVSSSLCCVEFVLTILWTQEQSTSLQDSQNCLLTGCPKAAWSSCKISASKLWLLMRHSTSSLHPAQCALSVIVFFSQDPSFSGQFEELCSQVTENKVYTNCSRWSKKGHRRSGVFTLVPIVHISMQVVNSLSACEHCAIKKLRHMLWSSKYGRNMQGWVANAWNLSVRHLHQDIKCIEKTPALSLFTRKQAPYHAFNYLVIACRTQDELIMMSCRCEITVDVWKWLWVIHQPKRSD